MATFGQRLRDLRNSRGISQNELSKHIGVSKSSVNMYERDEREPGFETLEAIADFFNVNMDYLLSGKTERAEKVQYIQIGPSDTGFPYGFYLYDLGFLEFKLRSIDCFLSEDNTTIKFPDGILTVTEEELRELDQSTDSYIRFKLQELREKNRGNFKPYEKREGLETPAVDGPGTAPEGE